MAQKKINDLTLRTDFDGTCNLPADDASQTWRVTGAQMLTYMKAAIAPLTTRGDLLVTGAAGAVARLALGTAGKILRSDGTDSLWNFPEPTIASKTANYTLVENDNLVKGDSSGGTFTLTLPAAAAGNAGKRYALKKTDTSVTAITVTDGTFSTTLNTIGEMIEVFSTGSAWELLRRYIPSISVTQSLTIGAVTTPPTKGTIGTEKYYWSRIGDKMKINWNFHQSTGGSGGSGAYLFPIPGGLAIDTTKFGVASNPGMSVCGSANFTTVSDNAMGSVIGYDANNLAMYIYGPGLGGPGLVGSAFCAITGANNRYSFEAMVPISGWNG